MKKILFVAQNLQIGGIQRALINMLDSLSTENDVRLFVFGDGPLKSEIPSHIQTIWGGRLLRLVATPFQVVLKSKNPLDIFLRCFLMAWVRIVGAEKLYATLLRKYQMEEPFDFSISYFTDGANSYFNQGTVQFVSDYTQAKKKAAWIHTDPLLSGFDRDVCYRRLRHFDHIVCVSDAVRQKMKILLPEYENKMLVFHNCFNASKIRALSHAYDAPYCEGVFRIVTVARVDNASKRIDGIVRLCARLKSENVDDFHWYIVGEGPDLSANTALAKELQVEDVLTFTGAKENPHPYIREADLFALYSAYEGFPMVVGEAMALDTFVLTANYAAAAEQIDSAHGDIAETDEEFYQKLKKQIVDFKERKAYAKN